MLDEPGERALGLARSHGEQPRTIPADRRMVRTVQVATHLVVDVVLAWLVRGRHVERRLLLRWWLAVLLVVVPAVADRVGAVHEDVEPAPLITVEVLHAEARAIARPLFEVVAPQRKRRRGKHVGDKTSITEPVHEL